MQPKAATWLLSAETLQSSPAMLCRPQAATATTRGSTAAPYPVAAAQAQAQRLSVAYNNLGGILKMQVMSAQDKSISMFPSIMSLSHLHA